VTRTITPASVIAITNQNVAAMDVDALEDAFTSNTAYANIHTASPSGSTMSTAFPAGEIRGQIHAVESEKDHDRGE
jgi:hypothetical protein